MTDKEGQNDRKLLELAAKAAGIDVWTCIDGEYYTADDVTAERLWNPLTDDGDALRLAVKLDLMINPIKGEINVYDGGDVDVFQYIEGDPYAATRRAIVRAAAELGKDSVEIGKTL